MAQQTQQSGQSQASAPSKTQTSETQKPAAKSDPLVEAARKNREAQKNAPKASAVFTNDNIPATPGAVSVVGSTAAETSGKSSASSDKTTGAGEASSSAKNNDEATWRKKFADARQKLAQDQAELSVLQRESDQLQLQYYPDPTKALMQSVDRSDIIKKQKAIDDKKKRSTPTSRPSRHSRANSAKQVAIPAGRESSAAQWKQSSSSRINPSCARCCAKL